MPPATPLTRAQPLAGRKVLPQKHHAEHHNKGRHQVDEHGRCAHTHTLNCVGIEQAERKQPQRTADGKPAQIPPVNFEILRAFYGQQHGGDNRHGAHTNQCYLASVKAKVGQNIYKYTVCAPARGSQQNHKHRGGFLLLHSFPSCVSVQPRSSPFEAVTFWYQ